MAVSKNRCLLYRLGNMAAFTLSLFVAGRLMSPFSWVSLRRQLRYLTIQNVCLNLGYFSLSALLECIGWAKSRGSLSVFVGTASWMVSTMFWGLMYVDPALVVPPSLAQFIPAWWNHLIHTWVAVAVLVDVAMDPPNPPSRRTSLFMVSGMIVWYIAQTEYLAQSHDVYLYPVLKTLSIFGRFTFYGITICTVLGIHQLFWMVVKRLTRQLTITRSDSDIDSDSDDDGKRHYTIINKVKHH